MFCIGLRFGRNGVSWPAPWASKPIWFCTKDYKRSNVFFVWSACATSSQVPSSVNTPLRGSRRSSWRRPASVLPWSHMLNQAINSPTPHRPSWCRPACGHQRCWRQTHSRPSQASATPPPLEHSAPLEFRFRPPYRMRSHWLPGFKGPSI